VNIDKMDKMEPEVTSYMCFVIQYRSGTAQ